MAQDNRAMDKQDIPQKADIIKLYTKNLTQEAEKGLLDPVIGRDKEIRRVIQVLSRRTKNNPCLIGEPGVGKTAISEGLAQRIINKDVPDILLNKQILSLDLAAMLAGSAFRGQFEDRLKAVINSVESSNGQIILFIDELHNLVGAGKVDGAMDASQILKPSLARGQMRVIGATTEDEYRQYIEKDQALERRFQVVYIQEPDPEDAISILRGLKEKYEVYHGVRIKDSAIVQAVQLSHRYISDRFLPDKAIDLMDEAAASLNIEMTSVPDEIDVLRRKLIQLKMEEQALLKEKDEVSKKRLKQIQGEIQTLSKEESQMVKIWESEKKDLLDVKNTKKKIEDLKAQMAHFQRNGNLQKAAEIKYSSLPKENDKMEKFEKQARTQKTTLLNEEVGVEEVAEIVSRWTGIPVDRIVKKQEQKLLTMEEDLKKQVVSQDHALKVVSDSIRRSRAGISDPKKPIGTFMFLGPTGVGKTQTAKALSYFLFDSEDKITRIDMSEFMERHSVYRLIGAPPGYIGFDKGGELTEYVRRHPYSVILLDEIEKAHPDVFNILLQVLDEGRLTDGKGRTVNFRNCVFIMTSNLGSSHLLEASKEKEKKVMDILFEHFKPEFLNRIDEFVFFKSLDQDSIRQIVSIQLDEIQTRLQDRGIQIKTHESAIDFLSKKGFDPQFGARPLKRAIESYLLNPLSNKILSNEFPENSIVEVKTNDLELTFNLKS